MLIVKISMKLLSVRRGVIEQQAILIRANSGLFIASVVVLVPLHCWIMMLIIDMINKRALDADL